MMKKRYVVEVRETLLAEITVEADNEKDAENIARCMYQGDTTILGDEYFCGRTVETVREATGEDEE